MYVRFFRDWYLMIITYVVFFDVDPRLLYAAKVAFDSTYKDPNSNVKALMDCMPQYAYMP